MIRKILVIICITAMLLCTGTMHFFSFAAESNNLTGAVYREEIDTLLRFGIFAPEDFDTEKNIGRGAFLGAAMKLTGQEEPKQAIDTVFSDVNADTPNSGAIKTAFDRGIISGFCDGTFGADKNITCGQAVKILVSILGYDVRARAYGGYFAGYASVAAELKLIKNIVIEADAECTYSLAARLIYNALHTDVLQSETYPESEYFTREGENAMTLWMDIYEVNGRILANEITSLDKAEGTKDGFVLIEADGKTEMFEQNGTNAGELLGLPVSAYYKKGEGEKNTLLSVNVDSSVEEVTINAEDIYDKTNEVTAYWNSGNKEASMKIGSGAAVIYNSRYYSHPINGELLKPESGSIKLADTDGDKMADVIFINDADIYVVKSVSASGVIRDKYNKPPVRIDLTSSDVKIKVTLNGEEIPFSDIKINMVLAITMSEDESYIRIEASSGKIKGTIEEIGTDYVVVEGEEYKIVKSNIAEIKKLKPGYNTNLFLTAGNAVAGCSSTDAPGTAYGYAVIGGIKAGGLEDGAFIKICTVGGTIQDFELSDKIQLSDGSTSVSGKGADILKQMVVAPLPQTDSKSDMQMVYCNQLIEYTVNNDGKISEITTAKNNTEYRKYIEKFSLDYSYRSVNNRYLVFRQFGFIDGRFDASGCYIFKVPEQSVWQSLYNGSPEVTLTDIEKQITCASTEDWGDNYRITNFDIFDLNEVKNCSVIVEYSKAEIVPELDLFLVDFVSNALDSEGTPAYKINGIYKGEYKGYILDMEYLSESDIKLKRGDVVRIAVDSAGNVREIYKIFTIRKEDAGDWQNGGFLLNGDEYNCYGHTASSDSPAPWSGYSLATTYAANWNRLHVVMHGKCSAVSGSTLLIDFGSREGQEQSPIDTRLLTDNVHSKYYVYDEKENEVRVGSIEDIDPDDSRQTIVARNRYYENYEGIIINRKDYIGDIYWVGQFNE